MSVSWSVIIMVGLDRFCNVSIVHKISCIIGGNLVLQELFVLSFVGEEN